MEPLTIFGAAVGGVTLVGEMMKLGRALHAMAKSIKYARGDIKAFSEELYLSATLLQDFRTSCSNDSNRHTGHRLDPVRLMIWTNRACRSLRELLDKVQPLSLDSEQSSSLVRIIYAHLEWLFSKRMVKYLRACLSVARESMHAFMNILQVENLNEQLDLLRQLVGTRSKQEVEVEPGKTAEECMNEIEEEL